MVTGQTSTVKCQATHKPASFWPQRSSEESPTLSSFVQRTSTDGVNGQKLQTSRLLESHTRCLNASLRINRMDQSFSSGIYLMWTVRASQTTRCRFLTQHSKPLIRAFVQPQISPPCNALYKWANLQVSLSIFSLISWLAWEREPLISMARANGQLSIRKALESDRYQPRWDLFLSYQKLKLILLWAGLNWMAVQQQATLRYCSTTCTGITVLMPM